MTDQPIQVPDVLAQFKQDSDNEAATLAADVTATNQAIATMQTQLAAQQLLLQKLQEQQALNQKFADLINQLLNPPAPLTTVG